MMEKERKPSHEEDEFLQLLMDYQPLVSSPLSPLPPRKTASGEKANNSIQNKLTSGDDEIMNSDHNKQSPSDLRVQDSVGSSSKDNFIVEEMEDVHDDEEEFFSKLLTMSDASVNGGSSNPPTVAQSADNDVVLFMTIPPEMFVQPPQTVTANTIARPRRGFRKAIAPEVLAELSMHDPKKARRIITNRISAVRAKEKKKLYTYMLEHKLQTLQTESASLNTYLTSLQAKRISLNAENARLKEQTSMVLQQIQLQDLINDDIRDEIRDLKMMAQMGPPNHHGIMFNNNNGNYGYNNFSMDSPLRTEQVFQVQNPYQLEQMHLRQQYPWQVQYDEQGQYEDMIPNHYLPQEENPQFVEETSIEKFVVSNRQAYQPSEESTNK